MSASLIGRLGSSAFQTIYHCSVGRRSRARGRARTRLTKPRRLRDHSTGELGAQAFALRRSRRGAPGPRHYEASAGDQSDTSPAPGRKKSSPGCCVNSTVRYSALKPSRLVHASIRHSANLARSSGGRPRRMSHLSTDAHSHGFPQRHMLPSLNSRTETTTFSALVSMTVA